MRRDDRGSAVIEFIVIGVCVMVPMLYIVQAVMTVHAAALASNQGVREAGRAFSLATSEAMGRTRAETAIRLAFADQGLAVPVSALQVTCPGSPCLAPGSSVEVALSWSVPLPWLPADWAGRGRLAIPITATLWLPIDDFRDTPDASQS